MTTIVPSAYVCQVVKVHDADGPIWCKGGGKIRVAGINAREVDGSCRTNAPCPTMRHKQAQAVIERLTLHKRLTCTVMDLSYGRLVAACRLPDGRDLSCAIVRAGAAVWWPVYVRRYGLEVCK